MQPKINRQRGVTLKEILVGFAIILVLLLLFQPQPYSREKARQVSCQSSMKQIGLAILQYSSDNDDQLPEGTRSTPGLGWAGQIYPYAKSTLLFRCPDDEDQTGIVSYAYNSNLARRRKDKGSQSLSTLPATLVLAFEVAHVQANVALPDEGASQGTRQFSAAGDGTGAGLHSTLRGNDSVKYATGHIGGQPVSQPDQFEDGRHQKRANYLFADGHVKVLAPEAIPIGGSTAGNMATFSVK